MSEPTTREGTAPERRVTLLAGQLDDALERLAEAPDFAKVRYQEDVFRLAADLLDRPGGQEALYEHAPRFDGAGAFHGGPWEDASRLLPDLVGFGLRGEGVYPTIEAMSELRMLAIATGKAESEQISRDDALVFLQETCAKCMDLMFPGDSEESRARPKIFRRAARLFALIREHIPVEGLHDRVVEEIGLICAQRPIVTRPAEDLVALAQRLEDAGEGEPDARLGRYRAALGPTTPRAADAGSWAAYREVLQGLGADELVEEGRGFAVALSATGLASPYHAILLRRLVQEQPASVGEVLGLGEGGCAEAGRHPELVALLVRQAIAPHTRSSILGLAGVLRRGLLSRSEVAGGLRRLVDLTVRSDVSDALLADLPEESGLDANSVLLAGSLGVLGQPLGVGQGNNPTCQSARGLSLWSQHAPGLLLGMVATAARDGFVSCNFEGKPLRSDQLQDGFLQGGRADPNLDPVSRILVPHLDRLYWRMMQLAALRGEDEHKWVNKELYGQWVTDGFASAIEHVTGVVRRHRQFVRRFYATHHPDYNGNHELIYPNPVGLMVTDVHGRLLGPHAVSIQRVARDADGDLRIYFYNPNNEGRQEWGQDIAPTVDGHGEWPGESSLPFGQFLSRLYAFHFDPQEEGDGWAVPEELVEPVHEMAATSWGRGLPAFA